MSLKNKMKIAFIHPDLGIGGAERLVVDAALGLKKLGHEVVIYTSYCDKDHCFEEIRRGDINVIVAGDSIFPRSILGKFSILCATLRQIHLVLSLQSTHKTYYDAFIVDQLSTCIPLLRDRSDPARILFYCHFPDQLLAKRDNIIRKIYRFPFDCLEQATTCLADSIVVNSKFTKSVFHNQFKSIEADPTVIYPCVPLCPSDDSNSIRVSEHTRSLRIDENAENSNSDPNHANDLAQFFASLPKFVLSINRFERKKNIELAIKSFAEAKSLISLNSLPANAVNLSSSNKSNILLIVAGGYDRRVRENREYLDELKALCSTLNLTSYTLQTSSSPPKDSFDVLFMPSISDTIKHTLLTSAQLMLYTPDREHFGIVPIESLAAGTAVLAANSGGPLETIEDGITGWHRDSSDPHAWAEIIAKVCDPNLPGSIPYTTYQKMSEAGKKASETEFSRDAMSKKFENEINRIRKSDKRGSSGLWNTLVLGTCMAYALFFLLIAIILQTYLPK